MAQHLSEGTVKVGCCGFRGSRSKYFERFSVVEVQHTFYEPPSLTTLTTWRTEAPPGFEFTLKAWQVITHRFDSPTYRRLKKLPAWLDEDACGAFQATDTVAEAMKTTLAAAAALRATHVVFQCPARFGPTEEHVDNLRRFFLSHPPAAGIRYCWEPRGAWPDALVKDLCDELKLLYVCDPFDRVPLPQTEHYYRLRVSKRGRYSFSEEELRELVLTVRDDPQTRIFFNNTEMLNDAERLKALLGRRELY